MAGLRYNMVVLPVTPAGQGTMRYQLSAGTRGEPRYVSPEWTAAEVCAALAGLGRSAWEIEELFRGNRSFVGRWDAPVQSFAAAELERIGMSPLVETEA